MPGAGDLWRPGSRRGLRAAPALHNQASGCDRHLARRHRRCIRSVGFFEILGLHAFRQAVDTVLADAQAALHAEAS